MKFHPEGDTFAIDPLIRVAPVAIHELPPKRKSTVAHEVRHLMQRLGRKRPEIPHAVGVAQVCLRMPLLGVDEIWKLYRIADEKNWRVVANEIVVAFLGVELECEAA